MLGHTPNLPPNHRDGWALKLRKFDAAVACAACYCAQGWWVTLLFHSLGKPRFGPVRALNFSKIWNWALWFAIVCFGITPLPAENTYSRFVVKTGHLDAELEDRFVTGPQEILVSNSSNGVNEEHLRRFVRTAYHEAVHEMERSRYRGTFGLDNGGNRQISQLFHWGRGAGLDCKYPAMGTDIERLRKAVIGDVNVDGVHPDQLEHIERQIPNRRADRNSWPFFAENKGNRVPARLRRFSGFARLPADYTPGQSCNYNQPPLGCSPPVGPFDGCVPGWRVVTGFGLICAATGLFIYAVRRRKGWLALFCYVLFLTGSLIWLTGHTTCPGCGNCQYHEDFQHGETVSDGARGRV